MKKDKIIKKISIALDKIRPYLQEDGGDIEFVSLDDDNSVKIMYETFGYVSNCSYIYI